MTAENGFNRAPLQSTAGTGVLFTEEEISWVHTEGTTESGSLLVVFVGAIDTSGEGKIQALEATFVGATTQMLTLAQEVTGDGRAYPSAHIFTLTEPTFSGTFPNTSGVISVKFNEVVSNVNAFSAVFSGVNTSSPGYLIPGSFTNQVVHNVTSTGTVSGTVPSTPGDLLVDFVVANAGLPDDHTIGADQILDARLAINTGGSAKMSVSHKFATSADRGKDMWRDDITAIETTTHVKFAIEML